MSRLVSGGAAALAMLVAVTVWASPAPAALHPGNLRLVTRTFDAASAAKVGGYARCPSGYKIVTGGAFWHLPGKGPDATLAQHWQVHDSTAAFDANRWYADGVNHSSTAAQLTVVAQCLPEAALAHYKLVIVTLQPNESSLVGSYLSCPAGDRVVAGGAFFHYPGQGPDPRRADNWELSDSSATFDAKGWYADGEGTPLARLTIVALCLPKSDAGVYAFKVLTLNANSAGLAGSYLACPPGQRIVTGGAFWHRPGQGPDSTRAGYWHVSDSSATFDAKGWYADGVTVDGTAQLTLSVQCLPK